MDVVCITPACTCHMQTSGPSLLFWLLLRSGTFPAASQRRHMQWGAGVAGGQHHRNRGRGGGEPVDGFRSLGAGLPVVPFQYLGQWLPLQSF